MKNILFKLTASIALLASILHACPQAGHATQDPIIQINNQEKLIEIMNRKGNIVIAFEMEHCPACKKMEPIIKNLADEHRYHNITFYKVNGPEMEASKAVLETIKQHIPGYPFILLMHQGKYFDKQAGYTHTIEEEIAKKLNRLNNCSRQYHHHCNRQ